MTTAESSTSIESTFSSGEEVYRSVSRAAIASLLLGIFGFAAFPLLFVLILPLLGLVFAVIAFSGFRRFPAELQGKPMAVAGAVICSGILVAAPLYHTYIYMTEVPEGYTRVDFAALMSPKGRQDVPTEFAVTIDGEQIFIKGYIHPSSMDTVKSKRFVLVPDLGTCCFGGQPPLTHMIEVSLLGDQYATKNYRKQRLAGTMRVFASKKPVDGLDGVYYQLRADILK